VSLSHDTLVNYYQVNFQLIQNHNYSLAEVENMIPWEREIYLSMLLDQIKEQQKEAERQKMSNGR
jgi:hypothetical protein|tara:strand:- start:655 stop:849 length:195 start_codon:yes stop_codon:yes gene_type:complete